ncbi:MAG TPA: hypothetical protein VGI64_06615 [Streptosporangiaceae bacterium]
MIRIIRARLPRGLHAFASRDGGTLVVFVSVTLPARQRAAAIRRALTAAPQAGWRSASSPVLLPALGGGLGASRVPETRCGWALGAAAAVTAIAVTVAIPVTAFAAGSAGVAAPPGSHPSAATSAATTRGSDMFLGLPAPEAQPRRQKGSGHDPLAPARKAPRREQEDEAMVPLGAGRPG